MVLRLVGAGRALLGVALIGSPKLASRLLLLGDASTGSQRFVLRIGGNRDLILGTAQVLAPADRARTLLVVGAAADAADTAVSLYALRDGLNRRAALASAAAALAYTLLQLWGLRQAQRRMPTVR